MNFPEIPENLGEMSDEALAALRATIRTAVLSITERGRSETLSDEDLANARAGRDAIEAIDAVAAERAAVAAELAELEASLEDEPEDEDSDEVTDDEPEADAEDAAGEDTEDEGEPEGDAVTAGAPAVARPTAAGVARRAPSTPRGPSAEDRLAQRFTAMAGVSGYSAGDTFENVIDLSSALMERWKSIRGSGAEKMGVAQIAGRFADGTDLEPGTVSYGDDVTEALTAGMDCVPREPIYDVGCASSESRPFANSLPNRRAPRGGYSVYPSPMLADVDNDDGGDGTGIWDRDDDGDSEAVKAACAVIPCGTPENYDIYGVYRCITVKNLHQMTHPELVAAFLNKLGALWARLAERTLLESALDSANVVDITGDVADDLGASVNLLDNLAQVAAVYTEQERYEDGLGFGVWLHRWVLTLLIRDWMRAPRYNPTFADLVAAKADVEAAFRKVGFNVHWVMDDPADWEAIGTQTAGAIEALPTKVDMLIAREGNFARLDEGSMTVGVTNRSPWDKDDMARNQFTMFWESGLVNYAAQDAPACVSNAS